MGAERARLAPPGKSRATRASPLQPTASSMRRACSFQAATAASASSGSSATSRIAPGRSSSRFGPVSRRDSRSFIGGDDDTRGSRRVWRPGKTRTGSRLAKILAAVAEVYRWEFKRRESMLWTIAVILLILWLLGFLAFEVGGGLIHLLLVIAVIVIVVRLLQGRRVV